MSTSSLFDLDVQTVEMGWGEKIGQVKQSLRKLPEERTKEDIVTIMSFILKSESAMLLSVTREQLFAAATQAVGVEFKADDILFMQRDANDRVIVLLEGMVTLSRVVSNLKKTIRKVQLVNALKGRFQSYSPKSEASPVGSPPSLKCDHSLPPV
jgi:hypothetical protein